MATDKYPKHKALNPFFDVVMKGLEGVVEGEHYYDAIARMPGSLPRLAGGDSRAGEFDCRLLGLRNYVILEKGDGLAVHHDRERGVATLEYQVHGKAVKTGAAYENRFVSIVTIKNRKIVRWRDYMDSLAAWNALTAKGSGVTP